MISKQKGNKESRLKNKTKELDKILSKQQDDEENLINKQKENFEKLTS